MAEERVSRRQNIKQRESRVGGRIKSRWESRVGEQSWGQNRK